MMNKILKYICAWLVLLNVGCAEDKLSVNPEDYLTPTKVQQEIKLGVSSPSIKTEDTRGVGTIGDLDTHPETNIWHKEKLFLYAINVAAADLSIDTINTEAGIPTFLFGGRGNNYLGFLGYAPDGENSGTIELDPEADPTINPRYYSLNGAYNFYGYHVDDAIVGDATISEDKKTIIIPVEFDGSQDILTGMAVPSVDDKKAMIHALFQNQKIQNDWDSYIDGNGEFLESTTEYEREIIEEELTKMYSSYSARRGVQPSIKFEHQLSRLTFKTLAGDKNAIVRDCTLEPSVMREIARYNQDIIYNSGDEFSFEFTDGVRHYKFIQNMPYNAWDDELFEDFSDYFVRIDFLSDHTYNTGEEVFYKDTKYVFNEPYSPGQTPNLSTVEKYTWTEYKENKSYVEGDYLTYKGEKYVIIEDVSAAENTSWEEIPSKVAPYKQGVFVTKVEVQNVYNTGILEIDKDGITFNVEKYYGALKANLPLKQRSLDKDGNPDPTLPLVGLRPAGAGSLNEEKSIGESVIVAPGEYVYFANVTIQEYIDSNGNLVDKAHRTKEYKNVRISLAQDNFEFERGKSYDVSIKVYSLQVIGITASVSEWEFGGSIEVSPDDEDAVNDTEIAGTSNNVYFGDGTDFPPSQLSTSKKTTLRNDEEDTLLFNFTNQSTVHWVAVAKDCEVTAWKNARDRDFIGNVLLYNSSTNISVGGVKYKIYYIEWSGDGMSGTYKISVKRNAESN